MKKTLTVSDSKNCILLMTTVKAGRRHDKRLADKEHLSQIIPGQVTILTYASLRGLQDKHPNVIMPKKVMEHYSVTEAENRTAASFQAYASFRARHSRL